MPYKLIGLRFTYEKTSLVLLDARICAPTEHVGEMSKGLNARNELDSEIEGIVVKFAKLSFGITSAHIAEIRLVFDHEAVLAAEHKHIQTHYRHLSEEIAGVIDAVTSLGNVHHCAVHLETGRFFYIYLYLAVADML